MALVLSDSTCCSFLRGAHYGIERLPGMEGFAVVASGGSLVVPGGQSPKWSVARMIADTLEQPEAPLSVWLKEAAGRGLAVRFIPARESVDPAGRTYEALERGRQLFGVSAHEARRTIMSYQTPERQLYRARQLHLRPQVAVEVLQEIIRDAAAEVDRALPIIVMAGWNAGEAVMVHEQLAARDLTQCQSFEALLSWGKLHGRRELHVIPDALPAWLWQTYINDDVAAVKENKQEMCAGHRRVFVDDSGLTARMQQFGGAMALGLLQRLQQPAHRADMFRYCLLYEHGGLYLDQKIGLTMPWSRTLELILEEWPAEWGAAPVDYLVAGIGRAKDHIFQGILQCRQGARC